MNKFLYLAQKLTDILGNGFKIEWSNNANDYDDIVSKRGILKETGTTYVQVANSNKQNAEKTSIQINFILPTNKSEMDQLTEIINDKFKLFVSTQQFVNNNRYLYVTFENRYQDTTYTYNGTEYVNMIYYFNVIDTAQFVNAAFTKVYIDGSELLGVFNITFGYKLNVNTSSTNSNGFALYTGYSKELNMTIDYNTIVDDTTQESIRDSVTSDLNSSTALTTFTIKYYDYYQDDDNYHLMFTKTMAIIDLSQTDQVGTCQTNRIVLAQIKV